jgi:serine/threonine-protein kinase
MLPALHEGEVVGGRFRLTAPIGEGGMGSIWQARDETTGKPVALKLVRAAHDGELRARFMREARVIRQFSHPNVVGVVDAGELPGEGLLFMAMELLHGSPLSNHLNPGQPLPAEEILPVLVDVCRGLAAAHEKGVIHRDVKPENIFLAIVEGRGVVPKVVDFGLSTAGDGRMEARISRTGQVLGTPQYMSPEQAMASRFTTPATDVWAVGVILYEAVSGKLPFGGANAGRQLDSIVRDEPAAVPAAVDARTRAIITRCLQKDPARRYPDAAALGADLERALAALRGESETPAPVTDAEPGSLQVRGALSDPERIAAEPPTTRDGRCQRHALARPKSPLLVAPFALALCALAVWTTQRRHAAVPLRVDAGLARLAKARAAAVTQQAEGAPAERPARLP